MRIILRGSTLLLLTVFTSVAFAQTEPPADSQEAAPIAEVEPVAPPPPPVDQRLEEAMARIKAAEGLFDSENYDAALAEFNEVKALLEGHPRQYRVLYNIGKCEEKLFRYNDAMSNYRLYLSQGGKDAEDASEVQAKISVLEGLLGTLRISSNVSDYEVWVDERMVGRSATEILVPSGSHVVELRKDGYQAAQQEVQLPARTTKELTFELNEIKEYKGMTPAVSIIFSVLSVGSLALGTIMAFRAKAKNDEAETLLMSGGEAALMAEDLRPKIKDLALIADIGLAAGLVFGAVAIITGLRTNWGGKGDDAKAEARLKLSPVASRHELGLMLGGSF